MRVLDLTHTIAENMPVYPGTETPIFAGANTYEKDGFKETKLTMYTHTGTHGPARASVRRPHDARRVPRLAVHRQGARYRVQRLERGQGHHARAHPAIRQRRGKCRFSALPPRLGQALGTDAYFGDYPCLDDAAMDYIIAGDYKGIGFDVIGLDPIADENLTRHKSSSKIRTSSTSKTSRTSTNAARGCFRSAASAQARKLRWFAHPRRGMVRGLIRYALMQQIERSGGIPW